MLWTECPGCVILHILSARQLVSNSNGDIPTKWIFLDFMKNVESPPELLQDNLVINKQIDSFLGKSHSSLPPDDFWVQNESSILGAIFHLIK